MNHFVKLDSGNVIWGYTYSDIAPSDEWTAIDFDASEAARAPTKQRLVNGALVDTGQPIFPPHPWTTWDADQSLWVDLRNLDALKDAKWEEIKAARATAEYGGFTWDGSTFDSDLASQQKIMGGAQLAGINAAYEVDWTLADNTVRHLVATEMIAVGTALGDHINTQYVHARTLRQQISDAQTTQELDAIVW